jgi:biopolymer transport protein ExbB/TolQ
MSLQLPQSANIGEWLQFLSTLSTPLIALCAVLHLIFFAILRLWYRRHLHVLAQTLDDFTRPLQYRSVLDRSSSLPAQIDAFVQDVHDLLNTPALAQQRQQCLARISILDEKRRYLDSLRFDTAWNAARSMIEAYPLSGILGTILAIGSALHAESAAGNVAAPVSLVMDRFGDSIWSSFVGLLAAIILMFVNSLCEVRFTRLTECRDNVRKLVARARRELQLAALPQQTTPDSHP